LPVAPVTTMVMWPPNWVLFSKDGPRGEKVTAEPGNFSPTQIVVDS
jgi:hypothetical protein